MFLLYMKYQLQKSLPESNASEKKGAPRCTCKSGSMTVEAAIVIPLMTCLLAFLLFYFRVMQVELSVQNALEETGRTTAVCAERERTEPISESVYFGMAKGMLMGTLGTDESVKRYVVGKAAGISLAESSFEGDEIYLCANYQMKFPITLLGRKMFHISQTTRYRKWTGQKNGQQSEEGDIWVYITETGTVYHKTSSCSYLELTIRSVDEKIVGDYRNEGGGKYHACEICAEKENPFQKVYITNYGDCYHRDLGCSGIKRTIEMIRLSEVSGKGACSKCWNQ